MPITEVRATGGGSQSASILQITADIFGRVVQRPHTVETSLLGAAIDAAVGLGFFSDFDAAVGAMTRVRDVFAPIRENQQIYEEIYRRVYLKLHRRLLPLYREAQAITGYPEK